MIDLSLNGVLKFLHAFGYLALPVDADNTHLTGAEPAGFMGKWTAAAEEALATYQKFHGLPVTGKHDDHVTLAKMCDRRCGHPDRPYAISQAQVMKWTKTDLRWKFVNYTLDIPQQEISASFEIGFKPWSDCTPLTFREVMANEESDIRITFKNIDGVSNILAQTWFPPEGRMEYDDSETMSLKLPIPRGAVDLASIHLHEVGHLIGLEHSSDPNDVMAPTYTGARRFLSENDKRRAQAYYGSHS